MGEHGQALDVLLQERRDAGAASGDARTRLWRRLRANAVLSGALWLATLLAGTALTAG